MYGTALEFVTSKIGNDYYCTSRRLMTEDLDTVVVHVDRFSDGWAMRLQNGKTLVIEWSSTKCKHIHGKRYRLFEPSNLQKRMG